MNTSHPQPRNRQPDRRLCVAPMMDATTRDFRYLCRLISRHTLLYTEMAVARALCHGDRERLLDFDAAEHPVALQIGGSDPGRLARAAEIGADWGYDEINLNVGCPSDRVQSARFGACLMAEPERVADAVAAMAARVAVPVTVKTRIGIDERDDYAFLYHFVETVRAAGCRSFSIHARKAWLTGLSPRENRDVPPLIHERTRQIKRDFPDCEVILNGGLERMEVIEDELQRVDGAMVGREVYRNPWFLADADQRIFAAESSPPDRHAVAERFLAYLEQRYAAGVHPRQVLRHALHLFQGVRGARAYRRYLSQHMHHREATPDVFARALELVPRAADSCDENRYQASGN